MLFLGNNRCVRAPEARGFCWSVTKALQQQCSEDLPLNPGGRALWRVSGPASLQSKANFKVGSGCSKPCPAQFLVPLGMEFPAPPLWWGLFLLKKSLE